MIVTDFSHWQPVHCQKIPVVNMNDVHDRYSGSDVCGSASRSTILIIPLVPERPIIKISQPEQIEARLYAHYVNATELDHKKEKQSLQVGTSQTQRRLLWFGHSVDFVTKDTIIV